MSKAKQKGTSAETAVVRYLQQNGFPHAERRALGGGSHGEDLGDITGTPALTFEVKNRKTYAFREWLRECEVEKTNAKADFCPLIAKPNGVGADNIHNWFFVMTLADGISLLREAGYGDAK